MKKFLSVIVLMTLFLVLSASLAGAAPLAQGEDYTVQADDWLSKLAEKFYGDVNAYWAIMAATNQVNADDPSYVKITNPDTIDVGSKLLIPAQADAEAFMASFDPAQADVGKLFASGASGQLLVGNWWTSGSEFAGINAIYDIYRAENPDVELIHAGIAGGAGTNFKGANLNKLISGDPFDVFQLHAGKEALLYSPEEYLMPVDDVLEEAGVLDVMPEDLKNILKIDGKTYTVPLNIHRGNVMWTNNRVLEQAGVAVPTTFEEFAAACKTLKAAGFVPLAQGSTDRFEVFHTFETVLPGTMGADKTLGLYDGTTSWADPGVTKALENFNTMLDCVNDDWGSINWVGGIDLVINDQAAFTIMGDWAFGEVLIKDATGYVGWNPPPGNEGLFNLVSDGFAVTKDAPNPENAAEFVKIMTRKEAQEGFNMNKGSICARTDCDYSKFSFPAYFEGSAADFASGRVLPSMAHGSAMHPAWQQQVSDIMTQFGSYRDVAAAQAALVLAAEDAGYPQ
jgi:glucose/mannose transport system substrate-binding protein